MSRAQRIAGISGIAGAVLFAVGNAIWGLDMPEDGTPVAEIVDWYEDVADRIVIGGSLSLLAVAVFLVFAGAMRRVLADAEGEDLLASIAFGGFLLGMAVGIGAEGINLAAALRAQDGELGGELAQALFEVYQVLGADAHRGRARSVRDRHRRGGAAQRPGAAALARDLHAGARRSCCSRRWRT